MFTIKEVEEAISCMKTNKSDGNYGLNTNHIKFSEKSLKVHLTLLTNMCFHYGIMPYDLLITTIVSIPKDLRQSLCDSDNYRGISLFSSIANCIYFIVILFKTR